MRRASFAAVVCAVVAASSAVRAETIREIVVGDNSKTTDETVIYLANIEEGDDWDLDVAERARRDLISSGLFKEVDVFAEPHPKGGVKVTILAVDKHSWIIAPTLYRQPTNRGAGVGFGENNLFGQNKKLLLYGQIATGDSFLIAAYVDPSIGGTPFSWQFDLFLQNERNIEYAAPTKWLESPKRVRESKLRYLNGGAKLGVTLFRSLSLDARLRGAYVFYSDPQLADGATLEDVGVVEGQPIPKPGAEGWDVSAEGILAFDRRANYFGITSGSKLQLAVERSLPRLGSDFDYWYGTLSFLRARQYFQTHNLILRSSVGYGEDVPFQHERTSGGTSLRGYENSQFRGDFKVAANLEYSLHLFHLPLPALGKVAVRGLGFFDSAYTSFLDIEDDDDFRNYLPGHVEQSGLSSFRNAVGGGIRLYARSIVLPLLGFDVGYGLEARAVEMWFAIGLTDF